MQWSQKKNTFKNFKPTNTLFKEKNYFRTYSHRTICSMNDFSLSTQSNLFNCLFVFINCHQMKQLHLMRFKREIADAQLISIKINFITVGSQKREIYFQKKKKQNKMISFRSHNSNYWIVSIAYYNQWLFMGLKVLTLLEFNY